MGTSTYQKTTNRTTFTQTEFFKLCEALKADATIPTGTLTTTQILKRHKFAVPGKETPRNSIIKALKATDLYKHARRIENHGSSPMKRAFIRLDRQEKLVRAIASRLNIDVSDLDQPVEP